MKLIINTLLFQSFPSYGVLAFVAKAANLKQLPASFSELCEGLEKTAQGQVATAKVEDLDIGKNWTPCYAHIGSQQKKHKLAGEGYLAEIKKGQSVFCQNLYLDIATAISLHAGVQARAYDLGSTKGNVKLDYNHNNLPFAQGDEGDAGTAKAWELGLQDDEKLLSRRWSWKQSIESLPSEKSEHVLFLIETMDKKSLILATDFCNSILQLTPAQLNSQNNALDLIAHKTLTIALHTPQPELPQNRAAQGKVKLKAPAEDYLHWADQMAQEIKERLDKDPKLAEIVAKDGLLVYDEKTPSGIIHVGSGRGWVLHDVIAKSLRKLGINAHFILSSDDYDPYDKANKDLDPNIYNPYLGRPFCEMPSPVKGYASFGDYYFQESTSRFKDLGIECSFESTADNYKNGVFDEQIRIILDNTQRVQEIYLKLYGSESEAAKKLPFNPKCPHCGKIATTVATQWDSQKGLLFYECKKGVVDWADGCEKSGWTSPFKGGGKFPWKVEWAAKWPARGVIVEFGGKDHFSKGGSRTVANRIAVDILNYPPPYPSQGYATGPGYEFFQVGGAKMSTSKGKGMSFSQAVDFFKSDLLRFLLLKSRPNSVVDFDPEKNDILLLTDQFDRMERVHFGIEKISDGERKVISRLYELVTVNSAKKTFSPQISLTIAAGAIQVALSIPLAIERLQQMGHLPQNLSPQDKDSVTERLELAQRWLKDYASDQFLFQLVDEHKACSTLTQSQAQAVSLFCAFLRALPEQVDPEELNTQIFDFARQNNFEQKELFEALYLALINKSRGPKLAGFISNIGFVRSAELLNYSLNASAN